jgi:hypothetical protein
MDELVSREIRRFRLRADCLRILARHTADVDQRRRLMEMAEAEDRKVAEAEAESDEPVSLEVRRRLSRPKRRSSSRQAPPPEVHQEHPQHRANARESAKFRRDLSL